jgi:FkbM family methyltransferase
MKFRNDLKKRLKENLKNNYGVENFDTIRFGPYKDEPVKSPTYKLKKSLMENVGLIEQLRIHRIIKRIESHLEPLDGLYNTLDIAGKDLLVNIIAYRLLGFRKVWLPTNNATYKMEVERAKSAKLGSETYDPHFMHLILDKYDLHPLGYDVKLFFNEVGIAIDFIIEQYAYKKEGKSMMQAEPGDTVLDLGACWGDTALYFASKVGDAGKVYSFEFIPDNIKLFRKNIDLNPHLKNRIHLVEQPVSNTSNIPLYFLDNGPGSRIEFAPFAAQTGETTSITIDDFAESQAIEKIDFIKMDIEGAELLALKGAEKTIRKYRPKLAIAIYHSMEDFVSIPQWILNLDLGYELFLDHFTIYGEETVIFAKPKLL